MRRLSLPLLVLACSTRPAASPPSPEPPAVSTPAALPIDAWLTRRGMSRSQLQAAHQGAAPSVQSGVSYQATTGLDLLRWPGVDVALYYYAGDSQVMLMVSDEDTLTGLAPAALRQRYGAPAAELRSRAGKPYSHRVVPGQGVAWSDDGSEVAFVELYAPTTLADWQTRFYVDPGAFIK